LQQRVLARPLLEQQGRRPEHHLVAVVEQLLAHPFAAQERPVHAPEIAEQELAVGLAHDLGVLLGHDAVQDLKRVVGMATNGIDGAELVLATLIVTGDDDFGHAGRAPGPPMGWPASYIIAIPPRPTDSEVKCPPPRVCQR